jgi:hypothetical protein
MRASRMMKIKAVFKVAVSLHPDSRIGRRLGRALESEAMANKANRHQKDEDLQRRQHGQQVFLRIISSRRPVWLPHQLSAVPSNGPVQLNDSHPRFGKAAQTPQPPTGQIFEVVAFWALRVSRRFGPAGVMAFSRRDPGPRGTTYRLPSNTTSVAAWAAEHSKPHTEIGSPTSSRDSMSASLPGSRANLYSDDACG